MYLPAMRDSIPREMSPLLKSLPREGRVMLSATEPSRLRPVRLRSSVMRAAPRAMASEGRRIRTSSPFRRMRPRSCGLAPKNDSTSSERPAPTRPPIPRISPRRTVKLTSLTLGGALHPCTSKTVSPRGTSRLGKTSSSSRPTIMVMSFFSVRDEAESVPMSAPSRRTVIRSAIWKISFILCEM